MNVIAIKLIQIIFFFQSYLSRDNANKASRNSQPDEEEEVLTQQIDLLRNEK